MPPQTQQSGLFAELGNRLVTEAAKSAYDKADYGNMELPGGIENGIAQIYAVKFDKFKDGPNKGKYYFMASGVVKAPATAPDGTPIVGLHTRIGPEPVCDTERGARKTLHEHLSWIQNEMRILLLPAGATPAQEKQVGDMLTGPNLEKTAAMLTQTKPHFRFRTWKPPKQVLAENPDTGRWQLYDEDDNGIRKLNRGSTDKSWGSYDQAKQANPFADSDSRVFHTWCGRVDYTPATGPGLRDNTGSAVARTNGTTQPSPPPRQAPAGGQTSVPAPGGTPGRTGPMAPTPEAESEFDETNDLDGLVAKAGIEGPAGQSAREELESQAIAAGYSKDDVEMATGWDAVAEMISNPKEAGATTVEENDSEEAAEEPTEEVVEESAGPQYKVGECVFYKPMVMDKATKKAVRAAKAVECEILSVNEVDQTVTLKNLDTGSAIVGKDKKPAPIKWDVLEATPA